MKRLIIYLAIAITAIGVFSYWYFRPERVIRRNTIALLNEINVSAETGRTARIMKGSAIANYFTAPTTLHSSYDFANGTFDQDEINGGCDMLTQQASTISILPDEPMEITLSGDQATVLLSAHVKAKMGRWIEVVDDDFTITIHWKKTEKGWKVHECTWRILP